MYCAADLGSKATKPGEEELREGECKVLVEEVTQESGHTVVRPTSVN